MTKKLSIGQASVPRVRKKRCGQRSVAQASELRAGAEQQETARARGHQLMRIDCGRQALGSLLGLSSSTLWMNILFSCPDTTFQIELINFKNGKCPNICCMVKNGSSRPLPRLVPFAPFFFKRTNEDKTINNLFRLLRQIFANAAAAYLVGNGVIQRLLRQNADDT